MEIRQPKVAIIDNSIDHSLYEPVAHWAAHIPFEWKAFRASQGCFPGFEDGFTHLILTGSEASIMDREPWVEMEAAVVREASQRNIPILGSCYGHQLLALALAGPEHVRRCSQPEIGWIPIQIFGSGGLLGNGGQAYAFTVHFDEVTGLGSEFDVFASTADCAVQAFRLKRKPVWGIQPHPEIDPRTGRRFLQDLLHSGHWASGLIEKALRMKPRDSGLILPIRRHFMGGPEGISFFP